MSNKIRDIDTKKHTYQIFDDIMDIKVFDPNNIKIDKNSYKNLPIYLTGYVKTKILEYVKIQSINPLHLIFSKVKGYFEEINKVST